LNARTLAASSPDRSGTAAGLQAGATQRLTADRSGERLDLFLVRTLPGCSRAAAQRLIDAGLVRIGERQGRASSRLNVGDLVEATVPAPRPSALVPEPMPLDVVYEDADLLVLNKPSGLVVHPAAGHVEHTLVHGLLAHCGDLSGVGGEQRPGIVHRLDRDTSGLLMVAKNDRAHVCLSRQLQERTTHKFYLALVEGEPRPPEGLIEAPIGRHPRDRKRMAVRAGGRQALTRYRTLAQRVGYSLLVAGLETGRTHQLRVHFAELGCPIAGDPIYGCAGGPAGRLWLHAWLLELRRPSDGEKLLLEAPLPAELLAGWHALGPLADGIGTIVARGRAWALAAMTAAAGAAQEAVPR
jgi:23S rRNA pseudouridine1911/1915/1917 synthase